MAATAMALSVLSSCVSNPAVHPAPTKDRPYVNATSAPASLRRAGAELDEQDYYELLGDKESLREVEGYRDSARSMSRIGVGMILLGIAVAAGTGIAGASAASGNEGTPTWVSVGALGGGVLLGLGYLVQARGHAAMPRRVLDGAHAARAYNKNRFGTPKFEASAIKSLTWTPVATYCAANGAKLETAVVKDRNGEVIDLASDVELGQMMADRTVGVGPGAWISYTTSVSEAEVTAIPELALGAGEPRPGVAVLSSPVRSLADLGKPVSVKAQVKDSDLTAGFTLQQSLTCHESLAFGGAKGKDGHDGQSGGADKYVGDTGGRGARGGTGGDGADVKVEAAFVTYKGKRHLLVIANDKLALVDPSAGSVTVSARGGEGGDGGSGGRGGSGGLASHGDCFGSGGSGGDGGPGGEGGRGGHITARGTAEALAALEFDVAGGEGGVAGGAGSRGYGRSSCSNGTGGKTGTRGTAGPDGQVSREETDASSLTKIADALGKNPAVRLEAPAEAPASAPAALATKKKRRR